MKDKANLITELKRNSRAAFSCIYRKYAHDAYILAYKYLGSKVMAEDAVQNLFVKLWDIRNTLDENLPLNRILFTIHKNNLLNILRDSKNNYFVVDNCLEMLNAIDGADAEIQNITEEKLEILKKAITQLSPQRKKILSLKITGKYSNLEIAEMMHLSVNTIKCQYSQSLKEIRLFAQNYAIELVLLVPTILPIF